MTESRRALIIGIAGQDGSYLAELLLAKGYEVHGVVRQQPSIGEANAEQFPRLAGIADRIMLHWGDLLDIDSVAHVVDSCSPHEIYNLAAAAFVPDSFDQPNLVHEVNAHAVRGLLEIVRDTLPSARFFQASTSEMFGDSPPPQDERTPFRPLSPYGVAKLEAHETVVEFRNNHGLFCCCGISFNHESPRRDLKYVTRKVAHAAARIKCGSATPVSLGNLEAKRDWGYAPEYVEAMWKMLNIAEPEDFVLATGVSHSVGEMARIAFDYLDLEMDEHVQVGDTTLLRPRDPLNLVGNAAKARDKLGWEPAVDLKSLIEMMVQADHDRLQRSGLEAQHTE